MAQTADTGLKLKLTRVSNNRVPNAVELILISSVKIKEAINVRRRCTLMFRVKIDVCFLKGKRDLSFDIRCQLKAGLTTNLNGKALFPLNVTINISQLFYGRERIGKQLV